MLCKIKKVTETYEFVFARLMEMVPEILETQDEFG